ncbi:DNA primase small subunit PriS [Stygiolobus caldivivus]|uniref:DNA primase small subunit PriS n=1 Tax=Stygiolobus caldivivus TaxID=2824673 RepID=A0A8D5U757_9CREN|nr:DNA primase small subunit PriS [Stygiolobus caldivivus]BCU70237.1 DNA primase [Stygiolobus caldivivus]
MRISTSRPELNKILLTLFREYYETAQLELPNDMELREFAYQPFNAETYARHLSFTNPDELKIFLREHVPLHLYYSSARYQLPQAENMEEKGWLGSDLLFDLDADEICELNVKRFCDGVEALMNCENSIEYVELTRECIGKVFQDALLIRDILKDDFGMEARIFFSGNRGFHIRVECHGDCALLDSNDRKEIADYISDPSPPYQGNQDAPGWAGRLAKGMRGVRIDSQVTVDTKRLVRIPGSINGKAGLKVFEVKGDNFEFNIESLSPFKGYVAFLSNVTTSLNLPDGKVELKKDTMVKLSAPIGIYLSLKGLGVIKAYVR